MTAITQKIRRVIAEGRAIRRLVEALRPEVAGIVCSVRSPPSVTLQRAEPVEPSMDDCEVAARVMRSYRRMREDIRDSGLEETYYPSSLWLRNLENGFAPLIRATDEDDAEGVARFLANALSWRENLGIMHGGTAHDFRLLTPMRRAYIKKRVFGDHIDLWRYLTGYRRPLTDLAHPRVGNADGAIIDGTFVPAHAFFHEYYGWQLGQLLAGTASPAVADLGGGYGTLAYYFLKHTPGAKVTLLDLPEVLSVAAFFLMRSFPKRTACLYGEDGHGGSRGADMDLRFLPPFELEGFEDGAFDLFVNTNSLGEMPASAVESYIPEICRTSRYFYHRNKTINPRPFPDGSKGLVSPQYPIPTSSRLLWRYPCIIQNIHRRAFRFSLRNDTFIYLYENSTVSDDRG